MPLCLETDRQVLFRLALEPVDGLEDDLDRLKHVARELQVPAGDEDDRPWERLRGTARWAGDPLSPVVDETDIVALG